MRESCKLMHLCYCCMFLTPPNLDIMLLTACSHTRAYRIAGVLFDQILMSISLHEQAI